MRKEALLGGLRSVEVVYKTSCLATGRELLRITGVQRTTTHKHLYSISPSPAKWSNSVKHSSLGQIGKSGVATKRLIKIVFVFATISTLLHDELVSDISVTDMGCFSTRTQAL